jgi:hypothetical protein
MENLIQANIISGASVYGVSQMSYTVDGVAGQDYIAALTAASFKESVAIEEMASAYSVGIRQREKKIEDLGSALAVINSAMATMNPKSNDTSRTGTHPDLPRVSELLSRQYGISIGNNGTSITFANALNAQSNIQYKMDVEDNDLQQDMVSLQSMISKRDNAFSTASKLVRKANNASRNTISNMGE